MWGEQTNFSALWIQVSKFSVALHLFPTLSRPVIQLRCWRKGWLKYSLRSNMTGGGVDAKLLLGWDELWWGVWGGGYCFLDTVLDWEKKCEERWDGSWKEGRPFAPSSTIKGRGLGETHGRLFRKSESHCGGEETIQDARASQKSR